MLGTKPHPAGRRCRTSSGTELLTPVRKATPPRVSRAATAAAPFKDKDQAKHAPTIKAIQLVDRILAARLDIFPRTVRAFGRALAATQPSSDHGRLLAATLKSLAAGTSRLADLPDEQHATAWLAFKGITPSPGAVAERVAAVGSRRARPARLADLPGELLCAGGCYVRLRVNLVL